MVRAVSIRTSFTTVWLLGTRGVATTVLGLAHDSSPFSSARVHQTECRTCGSAGPVTSIRFVVRTYQAQPPEPQPYFTMLIGLPGLNTHIHNEPVDVRAL